MKKQLLVSMLLCVTVNFAAQGASLTYGGRVSGSVRRAGSVESLVTEGVDYTTKQPDEILLSVFERLDIKSLTQAAQVSKKWRALAADTDGLQAVQALNRHDKDPVKAMVSAIESENLKAVAGFMKMYPRIVLWGEASPLQLAFGLGKFGATKTIFLALGENAKACIQERDSQHKTLLHHAVMLQGGDTVIEILPLFSKAVGDEFMKSLLSAVDEKDNSLLHCAVRSGRVQVLEYLLNLELLDIEATNSCDFPGYQSPLELASEAYFAGKRSGEDKEEQEKRFEIMQMLMQKGGK